MRYLQEPVNRSALIAYGHTPQVRTPEVGFTRTGPLRDSNALTMTYYPTIYIQDQACRATGRKRGPGGCFLQKRTTREELELLRWAIEALQARTALAGVFPHAPHMPSWRAVAALRAQHSHRAR